MPNVVVESSNFMDEMQPELQSKIYISIKFIIYFFQKCSNLIEFKRYSTNSRCCGSGWIECLYLFFVFVFQSF